MRHTLAFAQGMSGCGTDPSAPPPPPRASAGTGVTGTGQRCGAPCASQRKHSVKSKPTGAREQRPPGDTAHGCRWHHIQAAASVSLSGHNRSQRQQELHLHAEAGPNRRAKQDDTIAYVP